VIFSDFLESIRDFFRYVLVILTEFLGIFRDFLRILLGIFKGALSRRAHASILMIFRDFNDMQKSTNSSVYEENRASKFQCCVLKVFYDQVFAECFQVIQNIQPLQRVT